MNNDTWKTISTLTSPLLCTGSTLSTPPPSFHSSRLISIPVTPPPRFQQSARDVISWDLRASQLHDSVRVPAHGKPPFACAPNLPLSLSLSLFLFLQDILPDRGSHWFRIAFNSRIWKLEGHRGEGSTSIACQRENRWSVKRATNNFLLGKPPPTYRVSICRINESLQMGSVANELGKVGQPLDRFASRRETELQLLRRVVKPQVFRVKCE